MVEKTLELHKAVADEAIRKCILTRLAEMNDYKEVYEDGEYGTFVSSEATLGQKMQITKIFETGVNSGLINNMNEEEVNHFRSKLSLPEVKSKKDLTGGVEVQKSNQRDVGQKYSHQSTNKPDNVGK